LFTYNTKLWNFSTHFHKKSNLKNPSNGSQFDTCGWTIGYTDLMKLKGAFEFE